MRKIIVAALAALVLSGCGALKAVSESQIARDSIEIATMYAIEQASDRAAEARRIIDAAKEYKTWVDFKPVTFDQLIEAVNERIAKSDRELSEKAGLRLLLRRADTLLRDKVSAGELTIEDKATVNQFLDLVIQSAKVYAE